MNSMEQSLIYRVAYINYGTVGAGEASVITKHFEASIVISIGKP